MHPDLRQPLMPAFSLYLDLLRAGSALWVALSHLTLFGIASPDNRLRLPTDGHDAVVLFFILSGFLVAHAVQRKPAQGLRDYLLDRASRIYAVALPLLLLSFACALGGLINSLPAYQIAHWYFYLGLFLTFLNESLGYKEVPFLLYPWWSLAYEVWYYILFGCAVYLGGLKRWLLCGAIFMLMGPYLWLLMPVWLCGVIALVMPAPRWTRQTAIIMALTTVAVFLLIKLTGFDWQLREYVMHAWGGAKSRPFGNASYFSTDYITAVLALLHIVAMRQLLGGMPNALPAVLPRMITALAGVSFTLYLLHPLVYRLWTDALGRHNGNSAETLLVLAVAIATAFALAPITEYRRIWWRRQFDFLLDRLGWRNRDIRA
jgi:peptidoglycan/LPS O-acetylase OafA/YrhL